MNLFKSILYTAALCIGLQAANSIAFSLPRSVQKGLGYALITAGAANVAYLCARYQSINHKTVMVLCAYSLLYGGHRLLDSLPKESSN